MPIQRVTAISENYERGNLIAAGSTGALVGYAAKYFLPPLGNSEKLGNLLDGFEEPLKNQAKDTFNALKKSENKESVQTLEKAARAAIKSARPAALFMLIGSVIGVTIATLFNSLKRNEREYIRKLQEKELAEFSELAY